MNIEELRETIEKQTGIPAALLTGETIEENIAQARALFKYREEKTEEQAPKIPKSAEQTFVEWFNAMRSDGDQFTDIEEAARKDEQAAERAKEPNKSVEELFSEWLGHIRNRSLVTGRLL